MQQLTRQDVLTLRAHRHHLDHRAKSTDLVTVVHDVCGVQAQLISAAYASLWARVEGLTTQAIDTAVHKRRSLVKTWAMRGTVHILAGRDLPIILHGLARYGLRSHNQWLTRKGLDANTRISVVRAIERDLQPGPRTRTELGTAVRRAVGRWAAQYVEHAWGGVIKDACFQGVACFGEPRGQNATFVSLPKWLPGLEHSPVTNEAAEDELFLTYLGSYGPATITDFAYWTGMAVSDARTILPRVSGRVEEVLVDAVPHLMLRGMDGPSQSGTDTVRLLPNFDTYLLGHKNRSHLVPSAAYKFVFRKAGWISAVVVCGGRVIGTWTHQRRGKLLDVSVHLFEQPTRSVRSVLDVEATRFANFVGADHAHVKVEATVLR